MSELMHVVKVKGFKEKAWNKDKNLNFLSFALHTNPFHQMIQMHSISFFNFHTIFPVTFLT